MAQLGMPIRGRGIGVAIPRSNPKGIGVERVLCSLVCMAPQPLTLHMRAHASRDRDRTAHRHLHDTDTDGSKHRSVTSGTLMGDAGLCFVVGLQAG